MPGIPIVHRAGSGFHPTVLMAANASLTRSRVCAARLERPLICLRLTSHDVQRSSSKPVHARLENSGPGRASFPSNDFSSWQSEWIVGAA